MFQSLKYSNIILRFGLAFVFLWLGIDKLVHSDYWINAWYPGEVDSIIKGLGIKEVEIMNIIAIVEIIIGTSLISGFFIKVFSFIGFILLLISIIVFGLNEIMIMNVGIMAGLLALVIWPPRTI